MVRIISGIFLADTRATWTAAGICLGVGIILFIPIAMGQSIGVAAEEINTVFNTGTWQQRVAAMQRIEREKLDITRFPAYRELLQDAAPVERYYLARILALSRDAATYRHLLTMLGDSHPNVVCQVYYALGRRGHKAAAALIIDNIKQSAHWYTQWYGYEALKNLGWRQSKLKQQN
jgi:HEAT repeat protein